jgi:hypothetical protein
MARKNTKNMSEDYLVVAGIKVLEDISGPAVSRVYQAVAETSSKIDKAVGDVSDFWSALTSDGIISPAEKQTLLKEFSAIKTAEPVQAQAALDAGIPPDNATLTAYKTAYANLYRMLYTQLKLFDDMESPTEVSDRDGFNGMWQTYYTSLSNLQAVIDAQVISSIAAEVDEKIETAVKTIKEGEWLDGMIDADKLASGLRSDLQDVFTDAANGFATNAVVAMVDDAVRKLQAGISLSTDCASIKVADLDEKVAAEIKVEADRITAAVAYGENLGSAVALQKTRIAALVQAQTASAYMSLSVGVPVMLTDSEYAELCAVSDTVQGYMQACYTHVAAVFDSETYLLDPAAETATLQLLYNALVAAGKIQSSIMLKADQIMIDGKSIFTNGKLNAANTDYSAAKEYTDSAAESVSDDVSALIAALSASAEAGSTVIDGGKIKTDLIDVDDIFTKTLTLKNGGAVKSANYADADSNGIPESGFLFDGDSGAIKAVGGFLSDIFIGGNSIFNGEIQAGNLLLLNSGNLLKSEEVIAGETGLVAWNKLKTVCLKINVLYTCSKNSFYGDIQVYNIMKDNAHYPSPNYMRIFLNDSTIVIGSKDESVTKNIYIEVPLGNAKSMYLKDLPETAPTDSYAVWVNSDGFLKITGY